MAQEKTDILPVKIDFEGLDGKHESLGEGTVSSLTPEEEKKLVRRIDLHLMPIMFVSYILQYIDKTSLSNSAVLGLTTDLHLVGQQYSWASGVFYLGYLVASYPIGLGFVKFPLGKYLSLLIVLWGITLTLHVVAKDFASLMVLRTFLGVFESAISPGFSLITSTWYTPTEHVSRHSIWFSGNAIGGIVGSLIAYGIVFYTGSLAKWKVLFLVLGLITTAWGVVLFFFLPDSPLNARFLTASQQNFASLRPKKFLHTTQTRKWDQAQFIETLKDVKTWWIMLYAFVSSVPNGGISSFQTLIVQGFGFTVPQTILMNMPAYGFQFVAVVLIAVGTSVFPKSRLISLVVVFTITLVGALMLKLLPEAEKLPRLAGFWLSTMLAPFFPVLLSLCASNTAGFTKKSITFAMLFIGYCVGNFVGPQFFISTEAPAYRTAWTEILSCFAICILFPVVARVYLAWENKRRDEAQGFHIDPEESRQVDLDQDMDLATLDETDRKNPSFRYIL